MGEQYSKEGYEQAKEGQQNLEMDAIHYYPMRKLEKEAERRAARDRKRIKSLYTDGQKRRLN